MTAYWRVTALALVAAFSAGSAPRGAEQQVFSRSRWISEHAQLARFDGGLLAASPQSMQAALAARLARPGPPPTRNRRPPSGPANVRVSADILEADPASGAQPETEAEPSLAADPRDETHLVAGYQEDRFEDGGARALTFAVSEDAGKHWSEGLLPGLTRTNGGAFERASDPWLAYGPDGRVYYATIAFNETNPDNGVTVSASDDGGNSWGSPVFVHRNRSSDFDDKEAVVVDNAADSPWAGRIHVAWDTVSANGLQVLRVASSADGGASFGPAVDVWSRGQNLGAIPLVGPGGVAYLLWLSYLQTSVQLLAARSDDGGESWSVPVVVAEPRAHGVAQMRTGELIAAAIDVRRGTLYVTWQDERFTPGTDQIVLSTSADGVNWSAPQRVSDGPDNAPCFTPAVAVNGQGRFGISYSTLRNDPQRRFLVDQYFVTVDARRRLTGSSRVSTQSFDVRDAAIARGFFLGDYQGLVAGAKSFRPVWVATSENSRLRPGKQPDAVALFVP